MKLSAAILVLLTRSARAWIISTYLRAVAVNRFLNMFSVIAILLFIPMSSCNILIIILFLAFNLIP